MQNRVITTKPELRVSKEQDIKTIEGYFIRFDSPTELWSNTFEEVAPEAVERSLSDDIKCLFNHERGTVLGSSKNKTLELKADPKGLWGKVEVNEEDTEAMNVYSRVKRGDINTCSFGFYPLKEEVTENDDGSFIFRILDMDLSEVSIVAFPAYKDTHVEARQEQLADIKKAKLEKLRSKILKKYEGE